MAVGSSAIIATEAPAKTIQKLIPYVTPPEEIGRASCRERV